MLIEITYNVTDVFMSTTETPVYVEISFEQPGGTSAVWGSITGTLSNQTDLQNALNAKLDESTIDGGTEGQILSKASATDFDFAWINNYAKYLATNVRNQTGSTIGAFQVVYISGATGNKPLISLADADTEATSSKTYGVTATSIANNSTGDVVTAGELSGIDTSAFNEGDLLWLSTTAGGVVTSPPAEPAHAVFIGYVVRSHPTLGTIDVSIQNGYELNELHGVQITSAANNDGLFYNSTSTLWENKSITTALGYTPVPTTRNITINGVTYDLSADRTWTISTGISGSGASGQVTYWTGASAVSGSTSFLWDNSVGGLTVKSESSLSPLRGLINEQYNNGVQGAAMTFRKSRGTIATPANVLANDLVSAFSFSARVGGAFTIDRALFGANMATTTGIGLYFTAGSSDGSYTPALYIHPTSNVVVNGGGSIITGGVTDGGQRFQVYGDTLLRGSGSTNTTTGLTVQNSSSTNLLRVLNNGDVSFGADAMFWDAANSRLGIGTNAPAFSVSSVSNVNGTVGFEVINNSTGTIGNAGFVVRNSSSSAQLFKLSTGYTTYKILLANDLGFYNATAGDISILNDWGSGRIKFAAGGSTASQMTLFANGNLAINSGVTDLGVRFGVVGDTLLRGSGSTSATTALTVQNSSSTNLFTIANNGVLATSSITSYFSASILNAPDNYFGGGNTTLTSGYTYVFWANRRFLPTSGNATFSAFYIDSTINQTGGANGITRGLYVNPTLTSAADFRAIETTSGRIVFGNLPTSSAGLPTGALWNDAGTVKIV